MRIQKSALVSLCLPLAIAGIAESRAAEYSYDISAGAGYSDNIGRSPDDQAIDETAAVLALRLDWSHESNRLVSAIRTDVEYRDYVDGIAPNETVGSADASFDLSLAEDFFDWETEGRLRTLSGDPFQPDNPLNREKITQLATGPKFHFRFGKRTSIDVTGRYRLNSFEVSDIDNDVLSGQIQLGRALTPSRQLSLNLLAERIEYDDIQMNSNYDRQLASLGFSSEVSKGTLDAQIGWNEIHDNGVSLDGVFADIAFMRKVSIRSSFSASFSQQLSDGGNVFSLVEGIGQPFSDTRTIATTTDRFEYRQVSVGYNYLFGRNDFNLSVEDRKLTYESQSLNDRKLLVVRAQYARTFGSGWEVGIDASLGRVDFISVTREDDDRVIRLRLSRRLTENVDLNLSAAQFVRDSNEVGANYTENSAVLTLSYSR